MEEFLKTLGFQKDEMAPNSVNRWYISDASSYCSITLNMEGTETEYGFISWYYSSGDLKEKRKFTGSLTKEDIKVLLNLESTEFSFEVRRFPWSKFNLIHMNS